MISIQFSENLSFDGNAQYQSFTKQPESGNKGSLYLNADVGYYISNHQLQLIGGLGYQRSTFKRFSSEVLTIYPGITLETGKNYIIVISVPFDVYGVNSTKNTGLTFALTLTFD